MRSFVCRAAMATAVFCLAAPACLAGDPDASLQPRIAASAEELAAAGAATGGVSVVDLRTGQPLVDVGGDVPFIPASNQKILTSAFVLARLGGDACFTTAVYRLAGDLIVAGDGDPTLGDPRLAAAEGKSIYHELDGWAQAVRAKVGDRIEGDLIVCVSGPANGYRHADWPRGQWHRWYAAPVASLNFNNNCFDVTFSIDDGQASAVVSPVSRYIKVVNNVTVGTRHRWSATSNDDDSVLTISGTVTTGGGEPVSAAANNPPMLLGWVLADRLERAGVALGGTVRCVRHDSVDWTGAVCIARTTTPIAVAMNRANNTSLNMTAECLLLRAGDGTWRGSAKMMTQTLRQEYGLEDGQFVVGDGSGLSRANRVTPEAITSLLAQIARRQDARVFLDSLAVSGADGTLRRRLSDEPYRRRVLGKTGYIAGVSALSGYVLDGEGEPALAFSMLLNDVKSPRRARAFQDSVCRMLVDYVDAQD